MITVDDLYKHFSVLNNAKENVAQHEDSYVLMINGLKSGSHEKRLASQFVGRFFKFFPNFQEQSFESMFDLCEDPDVTVRKQVIKDLPMMCKACPNTCQKVSDILTQLLEGSDPLETNLVQMSLVSLMRVDTKATLAGNFGQILHGEEVVRTRAINFLTNKIKILVSEDLLAKEGSEEFFVTQCKKVLIDVTGTEFISFMKMLSVIPSMTSLQGRLQLLDIITDQADLSKDFNATDLDQVNCLIQCIRQAIHLFSKNVHSHEYVEYLCLKVLPHLDDIPSSDAKLELVRLLAEMIPFYGSLKSPELCINSLFERLLNYMPLPPVGSGEAEIMASIQKLQFSYVECLIFSFHHLAKNMPQFLAATEHGEKFKDFRLRLQYFARGAQGYMKSLKNAVDASSDEHASDEVKSLALKTTGNINVLIKDLLHNPPSYKALIILSFKKSCSLDASRGGTKRAASEKVNYEDQGKKVRNEQAIYVPPGGKYSQKAGNFPSYDRNKEWLSNKNGNVSRS